MLYRFGVHYFFTTHVHNVFLLPSPLQIAKAPNYKNVPILHNANGSCGPYFFNYAPHLWKNLRALYCAQ